MAVYIGKEIVFCNANSESNNEIFEYWLAKIVGVFPIDKKVVITDYRKVHEYDISDFEEYVKCYIREY